MKWCCLLVLFPAIQTVMSDSSHLRSFDTEFMHTQYKVYASENDTLPIIDFEFDSSGGTIEMSYDVALMYHFHPLPTRFLRNRTIFYFVACTEDQFRWLFSLGVSDYCFDGSYTTNFCDYIPLETSIEPTADLYLAQSSLNYSVSKPGRMYFFISNCELKGGAEAILRSCNQDDPNDDETCYSCQRDPNRVKGCVVAPPIGTEVVVNLGFSVSSSNGVYLSNEATAMPWLLAGLSTLSLGLLSFSWWNIQNARGRLPVDLQQKIILPLIQANVLFLFVWTIYLFAQRAGCNAATLANLRMAESVAYSVKKLLEAYCLMFIAYGWKITNLKLSVPIVRRIQGLCIVYGTTSFVLFLSLGVEVQPPVYFFLGWLFSWMAICLTVWTQTQLNIRMLRHQMLLARQHFQMNPLRTPFFTKFKLFLGLRNIIVGRLFAGFLAVFIPPIPGIINNEAVQDTIFDLAFCLGIAALFRCREFVYTTQRTVKVKEQKKDSKKVVFVTNPGNDRMLAVDTLKEVGSTCIN